MASTCRVEPDEEHTVQTSFSVFAKSIGLIGLAAAGPWVLSRMVPAHRASIRYYTATTATCGALGSLVHAASSFRNRHQRAAVRKTPTECPPRCETERFLGFSDGVILGGLASILMLSRLPFRTRLSRYALAASTCGVAAAFSAYRIAGIRDDQKLVRSLKAATGLESISFSEMTAAVKAMLSMAAEEPMHQSAGNTVAAFWGPFGPQKGDGDNSASGSGSRSMGRGSPSGGARRAPGDSEEHDASTSSNEPLDIRFSMSYSADYDWTSKNPMNDLEERLKQLTEHREQVAREAELLWSWLSIKELEYYNRYFKLTESPEKRSKRHYLRLLGQVHFVLWQEATAIDWRIADTRKQMSRLRSVDANGDMTWCIEQPSRAALIRPERAVGTLQEFEQQLAREQAQAQEAKWYMAQILSGFDENVHNEQIYHPEKNKMVSEKEMLAETRENLERQVERYEETQRVVRQLIADAKKRPTM